MRVSQVAETSIRGLALGDAGQFDWGTVGESRDEREVTAHRLHRPAQRREQQIAALLQPRDTVLADDQPSALVIAIPLTDDALYPAATRPAADVLADGIVRPCGLTTCVA